MLFHSHVTTVLSKIRHRTPHVDQSIPHVKSSSLSSDFSSEEEKVKEANPNSRNAFLELPPEIILCIAHCLEKEFRVLLSLTSKRMHAVMNSNMYLDLHDDLEQKKRFLAYLEKDYPEYLTCQACGLLYTWHLRRSVLANCPRFRYHPSKDILTSSAIKLRRGPTGWFEINSSVVQAIIRAQTRGPNFGLPLSYLNGTHKNYFNVPLTLEVRVVNACFLLHIHVNLSVQHLEGFQHQCDLADEILCIHGMHAIAARVWKSAQNRISYKKGLQIPPILKCFYCLTDFGLSFQMLPGKTPMIVVDKWQDFGTGYSDSTLVNQIYSSDPLVRFEDSILAQRDIEAEFKPQQESL